MAKKSRRSRRDLSKPSVTKRPNAAAPSASAQSTVLETASKRQTQAEATTRKTPDFSHEYHYVIYDLKRVGILAAVLLVGLLVLSFIL